MADDPYRYFRIEARELIDQIGQGVLDLENRARRPAAQDRSDPELVPRLLRLAHTLKGAARVVRQREIADRTHALEDALEPYRGSAEPVTPDTVAHLLGLVDGINEHLARLGTAPPEPQRASPEPQRASPEPRTASERASPPASAPGAEPAPAPAPAPAETSDVDELLDAIGEAHAQLAPLRRGLAALERASHGAELLAEQLAAPALHAHQVAARDRNRSIAAEITAELAGLGRLLGRAVEQTARELQQVRNSAERLRLAPAGAIFTALHRAARDVAEEQGKEVVFEGHGTDVRLDPKVLTEVHGALLHVVRNAVAHGIEAPAHRRAAGKPAAGRVVVEVARRGGRVAFSCRDDGRGFDLDAVRRVARRKGITPTGERELVGLLLRGGISTAETVTEVSGRGVGLDVVRDAAERLGGEVEVETNPGRGATVEIVVPLSLVSLDGLVVDSAGITTTIPLDAVRHSLRLRPEEIAYAASGATVLQDGQAVPFLSLAEVLAPRSAPPGGGATRVRPAAGHHGAAGRTGAAVTAMVVTAAAGSAVIGVDRLLGTDTVVVRALPELAPVSPVVGGVSLDGEGNPRLVLDPEGLVEQALRGGAGPAGAAPAAPRRPVLVIDDSLTTRMLEQSILESAGYTVDLAASAEEGLEKARATRYALFLVDIEMPGMDGFTFVERTRAEPDLRDVPAILVSSRASPEDRRRGEQAGACMHVEKSQFDQNELLEQIAKLVVG